MLKANLPMIWKRDFLYSHLSPSESASRLQTILNEIQPRDTNDYFNQAKILKDCDSFDLEALHASVPNIDTSAEVKGMYISNQYHSQYLSDYDTQGIIRAKVQNAPFLYSQLEATDVCRTFLENKVFLELIDDLF